MALGGREWGGVMDKNKQQQQTSLMFSNVKQEIHWCWNKSHNLESGLGYTDSAILV